MTTNQQLSPLYMIICGAAGTGKSYLIKAIAQWTAEKYILTGTTGMAAYNICGETLHSVLQLPIHNSNHKDLQDAALQRLQLKFRNKHYLLIDEMSMFSQTTLAWVDKCLRQATGKQDQPLGGLCNSW